MAQKVQIQLVDDIDDSVASETITFALDGVTYEIDLNEDHATELREALQPWITAGRRTGGRRITNAHPAGNGDNARIRAWALSQGIEVNARGRISQEIRAAFAKAQN